MGYQPSTTIKKGGVEGVVIGLIAAGSAKLASCSTRQTVLTFQPTTLWLGQLQSDQQFSKAL